jgi:phosphoenolpyruvate carboxykinase (GTP)
MAPFCGYNMADHWAHWLRTGATLNPETAPRIFQVNWFRKDDDGSFLWPGFGENSRVLAWILDRVDGEANADNGPLGLVPAENAIDTSGLDLREGDWEKLFAVDPEAWSREADMVEQFFATFDGRVPAEVTAQLAELRTRLG